MLCAKVFPVVQIGEKLKQTMTDCMMTEKSKSGELIRDFGSGELKYEKLFNTWYSQAVTVQAQCCIIYILLNLNVRGCFQSESITRWDRLIDGQLESLVRD